jgi:hypothetical protein
MGTWDRSRLIKELSRRIRTTNVPTRSWVFDCAVAPVIGNLRVGCLALFERGTFFTRGFEVTRDIVIKPANGTWMLEWHSLKLP